MYPKRIEVAQLLETKDPKSLKMVLGLDGFVDEIIHLVDKWTTPTAYKRIETIHDLAERVEKASGLSTNIEMIPLQKKIGGNGPIMCNALALHESLITYIGALGVPHIDPVFKEMEDKVTCFSLANNGHTDALEFHDGKLMLGKMAYLNEVTFEKMVEVIGLEKLSALIHQTDLLAMVNWSMIPHMTDIWHKLCDVILPLEKPRAKKPFVFVDLADPEKREAKDIVAAIETLKRFNTHFHVVLGLNKKESFDVSKVLGLHDFKAMPDDLSLLALPLYEKIGIHAVVIHPVDRSCMVMDGIYYEEKGPYVAQPKLTTGAGDNFNAGMILGLLLGLTPDQALLSGMATSGYYVRHAKSPNFKALIQFLEAWGNDYV